jgi:putative SOS response-associated peptidase YedK
MCGRYSFFSKTKINAQTLGVPEPSLFEPRYNIAPTQLIPVVRMATESRSWDQLRWGLIPSWASDPSIGNRMINARAETVAEKPAFRTAFKKRRCLIPADGFYEWMKEGKQKQPYHITVNGGEIFAFAGLWEEWHDPQGEVIESCTIITTGPIP